MKRRSVKVIKSRLEDIEVGDVVNRSPDAESGWFEVVTISTLFNGNIQLADESEQLTVSGDHKDMVGLQLVEEIVLDERGFVMSAAPTPLPPGPTPALPTTAASEATSPTAATGPAAEPPAALQGASAVAPDPAATVVVDRSSEVAAAADVATSTAPAQVDLGLVASLLENLDVGEAPSISADFGDRPMLPANAVAVDGGALPDQPSYKNPVVVPEGGMLPRRSRAA